MGSWISIISPNPRWIEDYGIWTQAAWSIALYDRSDSWGDSLYPTGLGNFLWEAEQADAEGNTRRSRELDAPETRSSTLRRGVSSRGPGTQTISTVVSPRSVSNKHGLRTDDTTASLKHTPGTDCSASRPSPMPGRGPLASSFALRPSLNTTGGSLPGPGSAPPHEDSDGESYQTLDSAWFDGADPDPRHPRPRSSHDSLTLSRRRRLGRPRRAPLAKLPLPRMSRTKRRREYRRRYAVLETSPIASSGRGAAGCRWLPRSFCAKVAPAPSSTPSTAAAVGAYRPNPMFGNRAGPVAYPRWEAICNVTVLYVSGG